MGKMRELKERAEGAIPALTDMLVMLYERKGGPGSGHWGHAGRPGHRGGSVAGNIAVSLRTGRTARERQQAAARQQEVRTGADVAGTGPGQFGATKGEELATDKQRQYADSLIQREQGAFWNKPWNSYNNRPDTYISTAIGRSNYDIYSVTVEGHRFLGDLLRPRALSWLSTLDTGQMSKRGISRFIDRIKTSNALGIWLQAHTDMTPDGIVKFVNRVTEAPILRTKITPSGAIDVLPVDARYWEE
jgi:hypothetical protein